MSILIEFDDEAYEGAMRFINEMEGWGAEVNGGQVVVEGAGQPDGAPEAGVYVSEATEMYTAIPGTKKFISFADLDSLYIH